jgi:ATP-dependent Lon protease
VARLDDVIARALVRKPVPIVWEEDAKEVAVNQEAGDEASGGLTAH